VAERANSLRCSLDPRLFRRHLLFPLPQLLHSRHLPSAIDCLPFAAPQHQEGGAVGAEHELYIDKAILTIRDLRKVNLWKLQFHYLQ